MNHTVHNKLVSFIWSIADDCLRDVYVRGKYRDVILPMVVLRHLDTLLEPTKENVLDEVAFQKNELGLTEWDDAGLRDASGYVFYNTSKWTLTQLHKTATNNQQILLANVEEYLNGFSANVKEIVDKFNLKAQVRHMASKDVLLDVLEKFTSPDINLTPDEIEDPDGNRLPELTNLGMGYVFEELIRKFNEETYAICKSDMMIKDNDPSKIRVGSTLSTDEFANERFDFMLSNPPYGKSWASEQKFIKDGADVIDSRFRVPLKDYWGNVDTLDATPRSSDGQLLFLMEMVSKMKVVANGAGGSRIASVHNDSSLFTGDAGSGESNIRRYIIENDLLEAIIQLPNNLFYNTGITTYIWLLYNNKPEQRQGKVQLIDAGQLFRKLRKNLGNKNCEFAPEHIQEIVDTYLQLASRERQADATGIAAQVFDNSDFAYYKVNIERPDRRKAQFSAERIETLRFDKTLREPMQWIYREWGDAVYQDGILASKEKAITTWCEENELNLNAKNRKKLLSPDLWQKHLKLVQIAQTLMNTIGEDEFNDYNQFKVLVDKTLKAQKITLGATEKNALLNAVSEYDKNAEKVIKKKQKLNSDELDQLLLHLGCSEKDLPDFGYYPAEKNGEYLIYESSSDLRDSESVPLKDQIHCYFLAEVKPHVPEAWINLDSTKIGYEISFNKYFYRHKPLRSMEEVARDIIDLEQQAEGLIAEILGVAVEEVSGAEHD